MLVEDDFKLRELLRAYPERDGLAVPSAGTGAEALDLATKDPRRTRVVLDLALPDIPGEEVARELRRRRPHRGARRQRPGGDVPVDRSRLGNSARHGRPPERRFGDDPLRGGGPGTRRPTPTVGPAAEAALALASRFEEAEVELTSELARVEVEGDQARLFQVVSNLLANAAKFTCPGGSVRLAVGSDAESGYVEVADNGVGIDPDELAHVFERFWRGRAAAGREGSGVGLAIVAELARAHGGRVEVRSSPGAGSTFRVQLPRASRPTERV